MDYMDSSKSFELGEINMYWVGMTQTDNIYRELVEGVEAGADYDAIRAKYEKNKGPFYNALSRFFTDIRAKVVELVSERNRAAEEATAERSELEGLKKEAGEIERSNKAKRNQNAELERVKGETERRLSGLDGRLNTKTELLDKVEKIEKLGFTSKRLEILREKVLEVGSKRGLKLGEAVSKFFDDLGSYDAKLGFELENRRLRSDTEAGKHEAGRWKAEAEHLEAEYRNRKNVVDQVERLNKQGVKDERILAWGRILNAAGQTPEKFETNLKHYGEMEKIINSRCTEIEHLKTREGDLRTGVGALEKRQADIENSIGVLTEAGVKQIKKLADFVGSEIQHLDAQAGKIHGGEVTLAKRAGELENVERELENARYFVNLPMATDLAKKLVEGWSPLPIVQYMLFAVEWSKQHFDMALAPPPSLVKMHPYATLGTIKLRVVEVFEWALYCASMALAASTMEKGGSHHGGK